MGLIPLPVIVPILTPHYIGRCLECLAAQEDVRAEVLVIPNRKGLQVAPHPQVRILAPGTNIGLAGAWNLGLREAYHMGFDRALLLNDDLFLTDPTTLQKFLNASPPLGEVWPTALWYARDRGFSCILIPRPVFEGVGGFDPGFWPAYFEDNCLHYRAKLLGIPTGLVDVETEHVGSGSLKADPEWENFNKNRAFPANMRRYVAKYGGLPHEETYTTPWNGQPPILGTKELLGIADDWR